MDLVVHGKKNVEINVSQQSSNLKVGGARDVKITLQPQNVELKPPANKGMAFEFVQKVIGGTGVVRCTYSEFQSMERLDGKTWYAVTTTADELRYLYLGPTLIAKASDDGGTWGFAYTFPIIFGR